jgi:hypothetical protein
MTNSDNRPAVEDEVQLETRIHQLEQRCHKLEKESATKTRLLYLSVIALYAVFGTLILLHWAGHVTRHT